MSTPSNGSSPSTPLLSKSSLHGSPVSTRSLTDKLDKFNNGSPRISRTCRQLEESFQLPDPLDLRHSLKSHAFIGGLRNKRVAEFYEHQNELIEEMLRPAYYVPSNEEERLVKLKIAIYGSVAANVMLFVLQIVAAYAMLLATDMQRFFSFYFSIRDCRRCIHGSRIIVK